ncbi:outer membrane efflux protein [Anaeromyxobacter sp. K]|uniref:TolC family protein n=1 Tax=Anaeromyxobacter sp. (strain K) TaxID=447217 RepID=UPI00015F9F11|nr:TolC family protein [Anaeromyxobacter sp. K]ACG73618.1 outer membrane efflux protein [Anaeromyxobacter sp. K]
MIRTTVLAALAAIPLAVRAEAPLTLAAALVEAERASPDLVAARARLDQARAASDRVRAGYLPQVKAGATYTRNSEEAKLELPVGYTVRDVGTPTSGAGLPGAPTSYAVVPSQVVGATIQARDQLGAQLELTQAILAPQLWFAIDAAGASARASAEQAEAARRELRFGVAQAFYAAAAAEQAVQVQERQLSVASLHERDAQVQVQAGTAARIALLRAQIDRARAEEDLVRARNALAGAKSTLAALLGRGEATDFPLAPPPAPELPGDLSPLEDEAVRLRPELRAAGAAVEAATASRRAETARYLPTLGAFGQARWSSVAGFTGKEESWAAGLSLQWELFDGGAREAGRREAGARLVEAEAARASLALQARDEVRRARLDLASARANRAKAEEQVALARENQRLVEVAFRAGQATSLEATDANVALATAELGAVNEGLAADLAALRLLRAAGLYGG